MLFLSVRLPVNYSGVKCLASCPLWVLCWACAEHGVEKVEDAALRLSSARNIIRDLEQLTLLAIIWVMWCPVCSRCSIRINCRISSLFEGPRASFVDFLNDSITLSTQHGIQKHGFSDREIIGSHLPSLTPLVLLLNRVDKKAPLFCSLISRMLGGVTSA